MNSTPSTALAPSITLTHCKSSNIQAHGYDAATKTLAIKFTSGTLYHYKHVPSDVADGMTNCKSVGSYFAQVVRPAFTGQKQA